MRKWFHKLIIALLAALLLPLTVSAQEKAGSMLAVIDLSGNLIIYDADGTNPFPLTTDADGRTKVYQMPTWSTDGRLAFFGVSVERADPYSLRMFVVEEVQAGAPYQVAYSSQEEILTYAYWAPEDCPTGNCRDLALLYTPPDRNMLGVRLIRDSDGTFEVIEVARGAPFYYSFAPDGKRMLWHRFGRRLELYDVASNRVEMTLPDLSGSFQAPMWSPVAGDERLLFAVQSASDPELSDLVIAEGDARLTLLSDQAAPLAFAWNADGTQVAVTSAFGALQVLDALSGTVVASSQIGQTVAHFWSPQGDKIAFLSLRRPAATRSTSFSGNGHSADDLQQAEQLQLTWYILEVGTGAEYPLDSFTPTREMIYFLNFFEQFARSHSFWSPDGRYLAYGALLVERSTAEVRIVAAEESGAVRKVGDGVIGVWSWR
jgi:hypothetical protein